MNSKISSKKSSSGSKRQIKLLFYKIRLWLVVSCCLILIFLAATNKLQDISKKLITNFYDISVDYGFKFNNLIIANIKNIPKSTIAATVDNLQGTSIFAVDINEIKTRIEKILWVRAVVVERRFPDTIYIGIAERQPVALWQNEYKMHLIDEDGYIIPISSTKNFNHLLLLIGSDAPLYANRLINDINLFPELYKHVIAATRYGERRWNLHFTNNILIKMPESDFKTALQYINELFKQDKLFTSNYKVIDLRDHKKYYIEKHKSIN